MIIHVVKPGESIFTISNKYGIPSEKIISDNKLTSPEKLVIGQTLVIMAENLPHKVTKGQSLFLISKFYGITVSDLLKANPQIKNPKRLTPGYVIQIPMSHTKLGTIEVNGYAFSNINMDVLRNTLPHLTYLSIFSYEVRPNGSLITINDAPLIQEARAARVAPMMVITNIAENAGFSSSLAHTILNREQIQNTLISNIIDTLKNKHYYGLDIDFEYIYPEDKDNYNKFLKKVTDTLHPLGYKVVTSLAPKTSSSQHGLLYEAHDYPVHGKHADHVLIMTYEWGYTYGPAEAVAPINQVKKVLDYAISEIPSKKILMGMPNYGYDWTLPFVRGSAARTLTNIGALDLARRQRVNIQYNSKSQAPFFHYTDNAGKKHEVWFDDARSIAARLHLVNQYHLGGISYWTINRFFAQNWLVLESLYNIKKIL